MKQKYRAKPDAISCEGPQPTLDSEGDEVPEWTVCAVDKDGEPVGKIYHVFDRMKAKLLAAQMADDRKLPLVDEAMPA